MKSNAMKEQGVVKGFRYCSTSVWPISMTLIGVALGVSCSDDGPDNLASDAGIFGDAGGSGGTGTNHDASVTGGAGGGSSTRCASVEPSGASPRIDDFDDGNALILPAANRSGAWYVWHDETPGTLTPEIFETVPGGPGSSVRMMRVQAEGFSFAGASLGVGIQHDDAGVLCPFDASAFRGVSFWARGSDTGKQTIRFAMPLYATTPPENYGSCVEPDICWDAPGRYVTLTSEWQQYTVLWDELVQQGWGTLVEIDPSKILGLAWTAEPDALPADFSIDDVRFVGEDSGSGGNGGVSGAGGAAGSGGSAAGGAGGGAGAAGAAGAPGVQP